MKKFFSVLLAVTVMLVCAFLIASAETESASYLSPTATLIPPSSDDQSTGAQPTAPTAPTSPTPITPTTPVGTTAGGGSTTPSGGSTTSVTKPGTSGSKTTGTSGALTTPDGSTVTGTAKPDENPESPKTGDAGAEVILFSAVAMTGACAAVLLRKKKDNTQ